METIYWKSQKIIQVLQVEESYYYNSKPSVVEHLFQSSTVFLFMTRN